MGTLVQDEIEELYALKDDSEELTNLAQHESMRGELLRLRQATLDELRRTDAAIVEHLPAVRSP